jgi:hypothetical protein
MKTRILSKILLLSCGFSILTAAAVQANPITYTYNGTPFTNVSGPFTTSDKVAGFVELMSALGPNLGPGLTSVTPLAFSFSDGVQTIDSSNSTLVDVRFTTNSTGAITGWLVEFFTNTGRIETANTIVGLDLGALVPFDTGPSGFVSYPGGLNPGTWTASTSVPEAGSPFGLLSLSIAALGVATRKFKRAAA